MLLHNSLAHRPTMARTLIHSRAAIGSQTLLLRLTSRNLDEVPCLRSQLPLELNERALGEHSKSRSVLTFDAVDLRWFNYEPAILTTVVHKLLPRRTPPNTVLPSRIPEIG